MEDPLISKDAEEIVKGIAEAPLTEGANIPPAEIWGHDAVLRDSGGAAFDAEIHATDEGGAPKYTAAGKFRKRPGRKKQPALAADATTPEGESEEEGGDYKATAEAVVATIEGVAVSFGGQRWAMSKSYERDGMISAWEKYFAAKGIDEIPPEWLLVLTMGGYAFKRIDFTSEEGRVSKWFKKVFRRPHARVDIGPHGNGQVYPPQDAGSAVQEERGRTFDLHSDPGRIG